MIIAANCPAHTVRNGAKEEIDIRVLVVKLFSHFSSSAKPTVALKSILTFLDSGEHYSKFNTSRESAMAISSGRHLSTGTKLSCC
jgi:hypothetical protein